MNEEQAAAIFIGNVLKASAAVTALVGTRIYEGLAPQGATYPYITFNLQSPGNDRTAPGADRRLMSRGLWLVKAITQSANYAPADAIANAIDAALLGSTGSVEAGAHIYTVLSIVRERGHRMPEVAGAVQYRHCGGLYRIQVTSRS